jgi:hypothetical protein
MTTRVFREAILSVSVFRYLTPYKQHHLAGTVKRLNVEHRTSNIEHPILMTLRFIYLKQANHAEDVI